MEVGEGLSGGAGDFLELKADATLTLNVLGPVAGDFSLSTSPAATVTVARDTSTAVLVTLDRTGANASNVALTATGALPYGMRLAFAPARVPPPPEPVPEPRDNLTSQVPGQAG